MKRKAKLTIQMTEDEKKMLESIARTQRTTLAHIIKEAIADEYPETGIFRRYAGNAGGTVEDKGQV